MAEGVLISVDDIKEDLRVKRIKAVNCFSRDQCFYFVWQKSFSSSSWKWYNPPQQSLFPPGLDYIDVFLFNLQSRYFVRFCSKTKTFNVEHSMLLMRVLFVEYFSCLDKEHGSSLFIEVISLFFLHLEQSFFSVLDLTVFFFILLKSSKDEIQDAQLVFTAMWVNHPSFSD